MSSPNYTGEQWRKNLDKSGACGILLTDLSKAFDCLNHQLLLAKLHAYGFDDLSLKVIQSYLSDRFQRVRVNASFSAWKKILTGVPQGSILGPELYNIYSNDLFYFLVLDIVNYADDNSPFSCTINIPQVLDNLKMEACVILKWIRDNEVKANPDKFHMVLSEKSPIYLIEVEGEKVFNSEKKKLLGTTIDT